MMTEVVAGFFPEHAHQKVGGARNQFFFLFNGGGFMRADLAIWVSSASCSGFTSPH